jgi:hypothetical protein
MEELVRFGGREYWFFLSVLLVARGADFLSTWIATPRLVLEGNPIARRLGWRGGALVNLLLCGLFALWPLAALMIATTSLLVAARNFQSAWLMRTLGEEFYRDWYVARIQQTHLALYLFCLGGQVVLPALIGAGLVMFYGGLLVPFAIGLGILGYALAVLLYTLLALWRIRRAARF